MHSAGGRIIVTSVRQVGADHIVNIGGGDKYLWGNYHPENESFVPFVPRGAGAPKTSALEGAQGGWWGAQAANDRNAAYFELRYKWGIRLKLHCGHCDRCRAS